MWSQRILKPVQIQALFLNAVEANHTLGHAKRCRPRDIIIPSAGHPLWRDAEKLEGSCMNKELHEGAWSMACRKELGRELGLTSA